MKGHILEIPGLGEAMEEQRKDFGGNDPTIKQKLEFMCVERGMFPNQAKATVLRAISEGPDRERVVMSGRWDDKASGYPEQMIAVLWMSVRRHALEFITETCPKAWFRPMFDDELAKEQGIVN